MERRQIEGVVRGVRYTVSQADPLQLGRDAPQDEYDGVSLKASGVLIRGGTVGDAVEAIDSAFRSDWGISMTTRQKRRLAKKLRWVPKRFA